MREAAAFILNDLMSAPPSQRELFRYYEHCRIRLEGHRVVCWKKNSQGDSEATSIPYCNTAYLLLGPGTTISSEAMELLAAANVVVGFTGASATPLNAATEPIVFANGTSEYRPTEYMQNWASWWFQEKTRIEKARELLRYRAKLIEQTWASSKIRGLFEQAQLPAPNPQGFFSSVPGAAKSSRKSVFSGRKSSEEISADLYADRVFSGNDTAKLLGQEGVHVQALYQYFASRYGVVFEGRVSEATDGVNGLLTQGNYIAYGLAASALHGLGISFAFPVLHGKKRRGALVFDMADPIKDAFVVPLAFLGAFRGVDRGEFRRMLKETLEDMDVLASTMKYIKRFSSQERIA